ncbi:exodeoxyribonuclease III [Erythrobacter dokdonensis]|uniref:Putative exodeoxyribonuclease III n=1 Tax=Erythrobacter dokdonensis DSW-74 TaxID=1300349 RepID=A0A1A7BH72_9SPHN|nr:exodeoxyribonuclease III [Erythrobacter dokdonensis]OBV10777.1 putative exodeoxyribonuclease III [Erythrobacter dokdonensis DSW-74]
MKIATFNINGIKARLPRLVEWLEETRPAVACLQEIKSQDEGFPAADIEALGYAAIWHGQKAFNGVAILADRQAGYDITEVRRGLGIDGPKDGEGEQARYLEADVNGVRIACLYLPNGNPQPGPKFDYKLAWMEKLRGRMAAIWAEEVPAVVLGDFNVIPHDDDVWSVKAMRDDALMQPESRAAYARLLADGWTDAIRAHNPRGGVWTYWDYQAGAWQRDHGFRIDHILLSPECADRLEAAGVDKAHRGREKASDHAPVWVKLQS